MKAINVLSLAVILSTSASWCLAQPAPAPVPEATETNQDSPAVATDAKRAACRQQAASKSMRGPDLADYVAVCVEEARLNCLKQAVAQKVRGPGRRDFIGKCMGQ
jgi:hypothetical protein